MYLPRKSLEPGPGLEIEVIRRLVEEHYVGVLEEDLGEGDAHLPATREFPQGSVEVALAEAETLEDLADSIAAAMVARAFDGVMDGRVLLDEAVGRPAIRGRGLEEATDLLLPREEALDEGIGLLGLLENREIVLEASLGRPGLGQIGDARPSRDGPLAPNRARRCRRGSS